MTANLLNRLMAVAVWATLALSPAARAAYTITALEVGNDVVITAQGSFNLSGLAPVAGFSDPRHGSLSRFETYIGACAGVATQQYLTGPVTGPAFPALFSILGDDSSGSCVYVEPRTRDGTGVARIGVPKDYSSGQFRTGSSTYSGKTLNSLGLTKGTYTWTWGSGAAADSITFQVGPRRGERDLNADGKTDLIWQNTRTGQRVVWFLNGTTFSGSADLGTLDPAWEFVGSGDFNGDGKTDLVLQHSVTGERVVWYLDGTGIIGGAVIAQIAPAWQIAVVADFNNDGKPDLVFQHSTTGQRVVWYMDGISYTGSGDFGTLDPAWQFVGSGDFNGDGKADLVLQNTTTGDCYTWFLDGVRIIGGQAIGRVPVAWRIATTGDFNGDTKPDIVLQNSVTGERVVWIMNGAVYSSGVGLVTVSPDWSLAR